MAEGPSLVDKIARSTAQYTVTEIAAEIASLILATDSEGHEELGVAVNLLAAAERIAKSQ